jgi:hypothetical protein
MSEEAITGAGTGDDAGAGWVTEEGIVVQPEDKVRESVQSFTICARACNTVEIDPLLAVKDPFSRTAT